VRFRAIAGNAGPIVVSLLAPRSIAAYPTTVDVLFTQPSLIDPGIDRVVIRAPINFLHTLLPAIEARGVVVEHVYDF
jgi:hypothetical protein